jgi:mannose-6-phosphate isomerase-like protein (cupin superfamily)
MNGSAGQGERDATSRGLVIGPG